MGLIAKIIADVETTIVIVIATHLSTGT